MPSLFDKDIIAEQEHQFTFRLNTVFYPERLLFEAASAIAKKAQVSFDKREGKYLLITIAPFDISSNSRHIGLEFINYTLSLREKTGS